jgi:NAD dependent epimerase/dehydratase family enzyme
MAGLLLTGQNVQPAHALAEGFAFQYPTLPEALQAIVGAPER